jgi:hypothetical protein
MANTITADNGTVSGSAGLKSSADSSGTLDIQTGSGTTAISINATQAVTIPGDLTVSGTFSAPGVGGNYALNSYVAPATWTKPANLKAIKVTVVGAGGAGGSALGNTTPSVTRGGGGGGGGGAAIEYLDAPAIPGPVAVTAGAGTNSFGPFCSATAGSTGGSGALPAAVFTAGGAGGAGSGGSVNLDGSGGGNVMSGTSVVSAVGGNSILGGGGLGRISLGAGNAGGNYGGGGGGALADSTPRAGGAGAPGIVIVEEFY